MSMPTLPRRLGSSDAAFLYAEREDAPMHIGAVAVLDGDLDAAAYGRALAAKLERLPRFVQKVVPAAFNLGHPTWERDPKFDLGRHLFTHQVAAPGGRAELFTAAGEVFTGMLDRAKPLWEIHVLRGLEGGRSALVSKVHHAMVDGVGANELVTTLFDLRPTTPPNEDAPAGASPAGPMAGEPALQPLDALLASTSTTVDAWSRASLALLEAGRTFTTEQAQITLQALNETVPDLALPLRRLPWNRPGSGRRRLVGTEFSFAEARGIRSALGGTVNDVVLAALGGGVASYCRRHGVATSRRAMRVMVPVNVRPESDRGALGNLVSLLPVNVPLDIDDPARRLRAIHGTTRILKAAKVAEGLHQMAVLWGSVPAPIQAAFGAIGAMTPAPVFNLVCTNVPGPQIRLFALEHPVIAYYPSVPVGFQMGLGCAIYSYDQRLFVGLTADVAACPDVELVLADLEQAFDELRDAAGVTSIATMHMPRQHDGHLLERAHAIAHHDHPAAVTPPPRASEARAGRQPARRRRKRGDAPSSGADVEHGSG
jgi:WS/DGAT/MGAT family acyltransferase